MEGDAEADAEGAAEEDPAEADHAGDDLRVGVNTL